MRQISNYEITTSKIDYYTWKIGALILLGAILVLLFLNQKPTEGEINDGYYHLGYFDCARYYNFTSEEMFILNQYRIFKLENKSAVLVLKDDS